MRRVVLESPYQGNFLQRWRNVAYGRMALRDSVMRGEAPIASHILFTQRGVLRDRNEAERRMGIEAGHAWIAQADAVVVYNDYGVSPGMLEAIRFARSVNIRIEYRRILSTVEDMENNLHEFPWGKT